VNAIAPAGVMTPLMREWAGTQYDPAAALKMVDSWHPLGPMATADEIGELCAFLLSAEASFITGQIICPDGGVTLGVSSMSFWRQPHEQRTKDQALSFHNRPATGKGRVLL